MIKQPTTMRIYPPTSQGLFPITSQPTIENAGAENYINQIISDGGQIINAMDAQPGRFVSIGGLLLAGDDSTFASDTGNWDTGDAGVSIAGGKLVFAAVAVGEGAEITVPVGAGDYTVQFTTDSISGGTLKIIVGGTDGTTRSTNATFTEDITAAAGTTIRFEVVTGPLTVNIDTVTADLKHAFRVDLETNAQQSYNALMLDGHNLLEALPAAARRNFQAFYNTIDTFGSATEIALANVFSGLFGENDPLQRYNGLNAKTVVANDVNLNFGTNIDFSIVCWVKIPTSASGNTMVVFDKGSSANGRYLIYISNDVARFQIRDGVNNVDIASTTNIVDDAWHLIIGTADRVGNSTIYIDGLPENTGDLSAAPVGDIDDIAEPLTFGVQSSDQISFDYIGDLKDNILYSLKLSELEALAHFNNPELYPLVANQWGSRESIVWVNSDFDTFISSGAVITQAISGVAGDNCYAPITARVGDTVTVKFTMTENAGSVGDLRFRTASANNLTTNATTHGSPSVGANTITFVASANDTFCGFRDDTGGTPKVDFAVSDFVYYVEGAVAAWQPDGISNDQTKWLDSVLHGLNGVNSNVEIVNGPDLDNLGFLLYEFDEVAANNLFWFFQQNQDSATALVNIKNGWLPLIKYFDFEIEQAGGYAGNYNYPGSKTADTVSGSISSEAFFGRKPSWNIKFNKMSNEDFFNLQSVVDSIAGKLYPFYVRFGVAMESGEIEEDRTVWRVRMAADGFTWSYDAGNDQPWTASLRMIVDL